MPPERSSLTEATNALMRSRAVRGALAAALVAVAGWAADSLRWQLGRPWRTDAEWSEQWVESARDAKEARLKVVDLDTRLQNHERAVWEAVVCMEYEVYCEDVTPRGRSDCRDQAVADFNARMRSSSHGTYEEEVRDLVGVMRRAAQQRPRKK